MDAKAKVVPVAWQYRWAGELPDGGRANWHEASEDAYRDQTHCTMGYEYRALVDLTDHEAALAELQASKDALNVSWNSLLDENKALEQSYAECWTDYGELSAKHERLQAGLEALAGEWEMRALEVDSYAETELDHAAVINLDAAAKRIRTLTNSAKGGE